MKTKTICLIIAVAISSTAVACNKADLDSDKGKYSYAIGYNIGSSMKKDNVDLDINSFNAAIQDALKGTESKLSQEQTQAAMQSLMMALQKKRSESSEGNKKKGEEFLAANKIKEGVKTTSSGLQYKVIKEGTGAKPKATDMVTVHYSGKLIDGKEFDSSYKRNEPVQFKLDGVIKGWTEGLQLMSAGSKYELFIPAELAYGAQGNQGIPGNSVLIFEVELISVGK
jgi:FKBP-type peptidyl-prolyl cis-trans isomerase